ncbi:MAG: Uma2 family endonuclease [Pirellulaceae bacterium]
MNTSPRFITSYTYEDYQLWEGDWQLIDGVAVAMTPSPFGRHERVVGEIFGELRQQLKDQGCDCRVYTGLDWIVSKDTVVRPDVMVVCGQQPDRYLERPPVLAVEVLSSSTRGLDLTTKRAIYQSAGVAYYLIVDPEGETVELCDYREGKLSSQHGHGDKFDLRLDDHCHATLVVEAMFR